MGLLAILAFLPALLFALIWVGIVTFLRRTRKKEAMYLILFTLFYVYLFKVLDYTLFQFQSLILLKHFVPNLMLQGIAAAESINLIPLVTLALEDMRTSLLNILLFVPFGFGLPFITSLRSKGVVVAGVLVSVSIEFLQLISGLIADITFRIADINDVIFNMLGAILGYILFIGFLHLCRRIPRDSRVRENPLLHYVLTRPQGAEKTELRV